METGKTKQLALDAMLAAMCAVLGYLSLDFISLKITFESLPVLLGALLLGPVNGCAIGLIGTLVYQLLRYGVTLTTPLWILPYAVCGFAVGLCAKRKGFELSQGQMTALVVLNELLITLLNTGVMYIDSLLYHYYFPGFITGSLALRLVICIGKAVAFAFLLPVVLKPARAALSQNAGANRRAAV